MPSKIPLVEIIKRAEDVHGKGRYDYSLITEENYKNTETKCSIKCNKCGKIFIQTFHNHIGNKQRCPYCYGGIKSTTKDFIKKAIGIHNNKYDYSKVNYINNSTKVKIFCNTCNKYFFQTPRIHLIGGGCPYCGIREAKQKRAYTTEEFIKKAKKVHRKDNYDYSKVNYINNHTPILIICHKHGEFHQLPSSHLYGIGCPLCGIEKRNRLNSKGKENFIKEAKLIHDNRYDYSKVDYINSYTPITIICHKHGEFSQLPKTHLKGCGCPLCNESKGEKKITYLLESKNINFISQYRFNDCKDKRLLPFDFYLPDYNICIEFDGEQHYKVIEHFGGENRLSYVQYHDSIKTNYCKQNNISLLRIKYDEDIESKLNQFLSDKCTIEIQSIFDL